MFLLIFLTLFLALLLVRFWFVPCFVCCLFIVCAVCLLFPLFAYCLLVYCLRPPLIIMIAIIITIMKKAIDKLQ